MTNKANSKLSFLCRNLKGCPLNLNPFAAEFFFGFRLNLNMLFSTMCLFFCYCFLVIFNTTVHYISNESEDISLLNPICNFNCMQLCFNW